MTGFGTLAVRVKPLQKAEQRAARAWFRSATVGELAQKRDRNGGWALVIQGGKA